MLASFKARVSECLSDHEVIDQYMQRSLCGMK